jgi:hypothetical protein
MKILNHLNNYPVNSLAKALQNHCNSLVSSPEQNHINQLEDLNKKLDSYTIDFSQNFRRCKSDDLKGEVHSYLTFEVYSLLYKDDILLISIISRKTEYEEAFSKCDASANSHPVMIN